jgi:hypothetical protein
MKFGRSYRVTIDPADDGDAIVVTLPFTVRFWIQRNTMASLNHMTLEILNLNERVRNRVFQDRFALTRYKKVTFEGGYDELSQVFSGEIFEACSYREGVDVVTRIESLSGYFDVSKTRTFTTIDKGKTLGDVFRFLIGEFPNLEFGAVGDYKDVLRRPITMNGNTYDLLKTYSQSQVFIDNGKVFVLRQNEAVKNEVILLDASTGLLETPRRGDGTLVLTTLFEPSVDIQRQVAVKSSVMPIYNGQYLVCGINHSGIISPTVGGNCRSVFDLIAGPPFVGNFVEVEGG